MINVVVLTLYNERLRGPDKTERWWCLINITGSGIDLTRRLEVHSTSVDVFVVTGTDEHHC